ncbi:MAG: crosslink repair DNA glycosylase YcaQ family protein [Vicinamibacteraceae bacterium]
MPERPTRLDLTRTQILAFRRSVQALDARLPKGAASLRRAAWAGLQDSMPRAALLSMHARVEGTVSTTWEAPSLVQVWGPRYSAYVVDARDAPIFTLGRLPDSGATRRVAEALADRLSRSLGDARTTQRAAARALGEPPNRLRYATLTGRIRLRWDGARQPTMWMAPPPGIGPSAARRELARRYLHVFGPGSPEAFAAWAGISTRAGAAIFAERRSSLLAVRTPIGDGWILASDEASFRRQPDAAAPARLLPSGDAYFLFQRADERALLVADAANRGRLWTSRVWPGALLIDGAIAGTWRRAGAAVSIEPWRRLTRGERQAIEAEAASLPLPGDLVGCSVLTPTRSGRRGGGPP